MNYVIVYTGTVLLFWDLSKKSVSQLLFSAHNVKILWIRGEGFQSLYLSVHFMEVNLPLLVPSQCPLPITLLADSNKKHKRCNVFYSSVPTKTE